MKSINKLENIPVIILAGGKGERYEGKTPKQLSLINKKPLIIHLINYLSTQGFTKFIIPLGANSSKFVNYFKKNKKQNYKIKNEIHLNLFNAGINVTKSERIYKSRKLIKDASHFCVCYGDILADVNLNKSLSILNTNNYDATLFGYYENSNYGHLKFKKNQVVNFVEKPKLKDPINIGFYIFKSNLLKLFKNTKKELETDIVPKLIKRKKLGIIIHKNFQYTVNTKKDFNNLINKLKKDKRFKKTIYG
jgi:glucose-1-phosphate cytidylyltransferase